MFSKKSVKTGLSKSRQSYGQLPKQSAESAESDTRLRYQLFNEGDDMDSQYDQTGDFDHEAIPLQAANTYTNI